MKKFFKLLLITAFIGQTSIANASCFDTFTEDSSVHKIISYELSPANPAMSDAYVREGIQFLGQRYGCEMTILDTVCTELDADRVCLVKVGGNLRGSFMVSHDLLDTGYFIFRRDD